MKTLLGARALAEHFDEIVQTDQDLVVDGRVVFLFRKSVISENMIAAAHVAWSCARAMY